MNPAKVTVINSKSTDPYFNLAYEEYLLNKLDEDELIIFFYKNHNTIVIGRNQNPWHETAHSKFINQGGKLARRFSGGGTVFHDDGNLNFSFLSSKKNYNLDWNFNLIQKTLKFFNIESQLTERYDLLIDQYKISGNAFYLKKNKACHHGTLLFNSELKKISKYLKSEIPITDGNYIASNPSPVVNLSKYNNDLKVYNFIFEFKNKLKSIIDCSSIVVKEVNPEKLNLNKKIYDKNISWDWIYGRTPNFTTCIKNKYISLKVKIERGYIKDINDFESEIINENKTRIIYYLNRFLVDEKFNPKNVYLALKSSLEQFNNQVLN